VISHFRGRSAPQAAESIEEAVVSEVILKCKLIVATKEMMTRIFESSVALCLDPVVPARPVGPPAPNYKDDP
jgi:hypothetical protein